MGFYTFFYCVSSMQKGDWIKRGPFPKIWQFCHRNGQILGNGLRLSQNPLFAYYLYVSCVLPEIEHFVEQPLSQLITLALLQQL